MFVLLGESLVVINGCSVPKQHALGNDLLHIHNRGIFVTAGCALTGTCVTTSGFVFIESEIRFGSKKYMHTAFQRHRVSWKASFGILHHRGH